MLCVQYVTWCLCFRAKCITGKCQHRADLCLFSRTLQLSASNAYAICSLLLEMSKEHLDCMFQKQTTHDYIHDSIWIGSSTTSNVGHVSAHHSCAIAGTAKQTGKSTWLLQHASSMTAHPACHCHCLPSLFFLKFMDMKQRLLSCT